MITRLRAIAFGLVRALEGMRRRLLPSLLATGAIGVSLVLVGILYLTSTNVARITGGWGQGVQMVVYLEEGASAERARAIGRILSQVPAVERVDYVPPDVAHRRLLDSLGDRRALLEGVEVGYLPSSLEVTLAGGVRDVAAVSPIVSKLRATPGVEEVEFLGDWVDRLTSLLGALRASALALALLVAGACLYVVASTIKLGVYARRDELEILKLVGATDRFVKGPLLVEGALQGALGAGAAASLLYLFYRLAGPALERMLQGALGPLDLTFLPGTQVAAVVAAGALLGVAGSWLAIGRYAEA
jgi:cell division transport system permease protein